MGGSDNELKLCPFCGAKVVDEQRVAELEAELQARELYPDGFVPHSELIARMGELESLVHDMRRLIGLSADIPATINGCKLIDKRMHALGINED